jgi:hypothetical protein
MSNLPDKPATAAVAAFLKRIEGMPQARPASGRRGRLVFAIDATASRQPTWDRACQLQGEMFQATRDLGGLAVQLAYYRGFLEFAATPFLTDGQELTRRMAGVQCLGGQTQIQRVLDHVLSETKRSRKRSTRSATPPASSACTARRSSPSTKAATRKPPMR